MAMLTNASKLQRRNLGVMAFSVVERVFEGNPTAPVQWLARFSAGRVALVAAYGAQEET